MAVHGNRHPGKASSEGLEIARGARKSGRRPHGSGSSLLLGALLPTLLLAGVSPPAWAGSRDLLSGARKRGRIRRLSGDAGGEGRLRPEPSREWPYRRFLY